MARETLSQSVEELDGRRKKAALSILKKSKTLLAKNKVVAYELNMLEEYKQWLAAGRPNVDFDKHRNWVLFVDALRKRLKLELSQEEKNAIKEDNEQRKYPWGRPKDKRSKNNS